MEYTGNLKNCRVLMKRVSNGELIADTVITDYDVNTNILKIRPSSLQIEKTLLKAEAVYVLVFTESGLYEYQGTIRGAVVANEIDVALAGKKEKESRETHRYAVQVKGSVDAIILEGQEVPLREPIEFVSRDVSAKGVLFRTITGSFEEGDKLRLTLDLAGTKLQGEYEVVRKQNGNLWTEEYGCRSVMLEKEGE